MTFFTGGAKKQLKPTPLAILVLVLTSFLFGACAHRPDPLTEPEAYAYYKETNDPIEPFNRAMLKFNTVIEKGIIKPVTTVYRTILPLPARRGITNVLWNLESPVILANDLLQGESGRAWDTTRRFVINSTVGIAGLFDVAKHIGIERHDEDFGQTLAVHGAGEGPYLVLPFFGPSNPRDGIGLFVDILMDPFFWLLRAKDADALRITRTAVDAVDTYDRHLDDLEDLRESSLDFYAALRSAYRQNRASEIRNGRPVPVDELEDDIFEELDEELEQEGGQVISRQSDVMQLYGRHISD